MERPKSGSKAAAEAAKRDNLGQLLLKAARLYDQEARRRVAESGGGELRPAHARLFPHIDWEGTRVTELAARVGATKQAVGQTVAELEAEGIVARRRDPKDARARLVTFTAKGRRAMVHGLGVLADLEHDLDGRLTLRERATLKRGLSAIVEAFTPED